MPFSKEIQDFIRKYPPLQAIGNTPLVQLDIEDLNESVSIYSKFEQLNPGGSIKDRPVLRMLAKAILNGDLTKDKIILDATSGNVTFTGGEAGNLTLKGDVTSLGTFTSNSAGTVTYNGGSSQNLPGTPTYNNLTINNTSNVVLTGSPQVDGTLDFTNGNITTNANSLIFGNSSPATVPTATNTKHIIGNCSKIFGTSTEFTYPIGDDTLRPIKLTTSGGGSDVTTYRVTYQGNTGPDIADLGSGFTSPGGYVSGGAGSPNNGYHFDITRSVDAGTPKDVILSVSWANTQLWGMQGGTGNAVTDLANMTFAPTIFA